jgi:hypothetical protein
LLFRSANLSDIQALSQADKLELVKDWDSWNHFSQSQGFGLWATTQYPDSGLLSQIGEALLERYGYHD